MKSQKLTALLLSALAICNAAGCSSIEDETPDPIRLQEPRLAPLAESEWNERQGGLLTPFKDSDGSVLNVLTTIGRHPQLFERYLPFGVYVLQEQTLPARDREMLILRIGWLCHAEYEFGHHTLDGKGVGLTDEEVLRITQGPDDPG